MRARFSPRGACGGDVSIDTDPESVAADKLAGVVDFSFAANLRLGHFTGAAPGGEFAHCLAYG